jgi:hypothetical protein
MSWSLRLATKATWVAHALSLQRVAATAKSSTGGHWGRGGGPAPPQTATLDTYQSHRGPAGWDTRALTPTPSEPLSGPEELQEAVFWTEDLSQTIFRTPESYAAGDQRPKGSGGDDLYLQGPTGALKWLSQGPRGDGSGPFPTRFDASTPNASEVVFSTLEPLTANATGLASDPWAEYLYARNVEDESTELVDVGNGSRLITPYGATIGDAGRPKNGFFSFTNSSEYQGSVTHAISEDGSKIFFETPPAGVEDLPEGTKPHLYMRDLADGTTTPLDDPASTGTARYEGASASGSLVFFTSDEGLDGASQANELYEFNTTAGAIGAAPAMSAIPLASGVGVIGVTAISNDGSHVFFVASDILASNTDSAGRSAVATQPNLYVYETTSGKTKFIATLAQADVSECKPTCATTEPTGLVGTPDVLRPAYPTPDGSVLVFSSSADLTGAAHAPTTTLTAKAQPGERTLTVDSTVGFLPRRLVAVGSGEQEELDTVEAIDSPTELTLSESALGTVLVNEHPAGTSVVAVNAEVYRYTTADSSLICLSCTPPGALSTYGASFGEASGGSYAPDGHAAQMSEDGSRIFFDSPDPLLPGISAAVTDTLYPPTNLYEWDHGEVYLISDASMNGSVFDGTTPSAQDVYFSTSSPLVPGAQAGYEHIYDARVDGGFPEEPPPTNPCGPESCRTLTGTPNFISVPASASEPSEVSAGEVPTRALIVGKITAAQLRNLVRVTLTVRANMAGEVRATATATLFGRRRLVAQAAAELRDGGTRRLTLTLSRAALSELAKRKSLAVRVEVREGTTSAAASTVLTLHGASHHPPAAAPRRHHA